MAFDDSVLTKNLKIGSNKNPLPVNAPDPEDDRYQWQKDLEESDFMKNWSDKVKGWEEKVANASKATENWAHVEVLKRTFNIIGSSYRDAFEAFEMLSKGGKEFETRVNNRVRRSMALQPDDVIKGVFASYSVKKLANEYTDILIDTSNKDTISLYTSNGEGDTSIHWGGSKNKPTGRPRKGLFFTEFPGVVTEGENEVGAAEPDETGEFAFAETSVSGIPENNLADLQASEHPGLEETSPGNNEPKDFEPLEVGADRKPFFDNNIVELLPASFLEMSFSQCISTIARDDPSLTNCQFILYRKNNQGEPEVFNFRIKNWQVPEAERKVGNIKYGNGVMSVAVNRYDTHKTLVDMDVILDRQLNTLRHIMEAVGMGTIEGDFLNLSEGFDNQYRDLGTVYLQVVPNWYLTTEQNLGSPIGVYKNWRNAAEEVNSEGEPVEEGNPLRYPLFCFTNVRLRTLDLPLKFNTKENGKAWTVKVQASYEKLYETSAEVKADLLKSAVVDPTLAFAKYESN